MSKKPTDDPDETEGRKLYRQAADSLAQAQLSLASRTVKMKSAQTATDDADDTAKSTEQLQRDFARERWVGEIQLFLEQMIEAAPDETCRIFARDLWDRTAEEFDDE